MLATDAVIRYTLSTNTCVPVLLSVILYMKNIQAKKPKKNYCLKIVLERYIGHWTDILCIFI